MTSLPLRCLYPFIAVAAVTHTLHHVQFALCVWQCIVDCCEGFDEDVLADAVAKFLLELFQAILERSFLGLSSPQNCKIAPTRPSGVSFSVRYRSTPPSVLPITTEGVAVESYAAFAGFSTSSAVTITRQ